MPNIIVFGEAGAGKSSLINMLDGTEQAGISSSARGLMLTRVRYEKTINDLTFNIFDTVGLNEGMTGTVSSRGAIEALYNLTRELNDGISLLVFVMRAPRITTIAQLNYKVLCDIICQKEVPIVIVITGLELESDRDGWWHRNRGAFDQYEMFFQGSACITTIKGMVDGKPLFGNAYEESKKKVERLFYDSYSKAPWIMPPTSGLAGILAKALTIFRIKHHVRDTKLGSALKSYGEWLDNEAPFAFNGANNNPQGFKAGSAIGQEVLPNVIVFGEAGVGKSSVINMLDGADKANVSNSATGGSKCDTPYKRTIRGTTFNVFDTVGLNQGGERVTPREAIEGLYNLICCLENGLNLLVFVMRVSRITATAQQIYKMFYDIVCNREVPIVIVVTSLEFEPDMDGWFRRNREVFDRKQMIFQGSACITAKDPPSNEHSFEESKVKLERLIYESYSMASWKVPRRSWFADTVLRVVDVFGFRPGDFDRDTDLLDLLKSYGGLTDGEAKYLAKKMGRRTKDRRRI